jgi:hypothetical protein
VHVKGILHALPFITKNVPDPFYLRNDTNRKRGKESGNVLWLLRLPRAKLIRVVCHTLPSEQCFYLPISSSYVDVFLRHNITANRRQNMLFGLVLYSQPFGTKRNILTHGNEREA